MAVFGIPGGAEWWLITGLLVLAFGPSAIVAWLAYQLGISRGSERAKDGSDGTSAEGQRPEAESLPSAEREEDEHV